jgi:hypothetical protein
VAVARCFPSGDHATAFTSSAVRKTPSAVICGALLGSIGALGV